MMDAKRIEEIRQRAEAATEGPWYYVELDRYVISSEFTNRETAVAYGEKDAEFVAHAREDIPALLAEVERLRDSVEAAKRIVDNLTRENAVLKGEKPITVRLNGGDTDD